MKKEFTLTVLMGHDAVELYEEGYTRKTRAARIKFAEMCSDRAGGCSDGVLVQKFNTEVERTAFINGMYAIDPSYYSILD